jgi:hypothetical protein
MYGTWTIFLESFKMSFGAIALVSFEAIFRIHLSIFPHEAISLNFGNNAGSSYRKA